MRTFINILMYIFACIGLYTLILYLYAIIGNPSTFTDYEGFYTAITTPFILEFLINLKKGE